VLTAQEEIRGAIDLHHQEAASSVSIGTCSRHPRPADLQVADVMVHRKNTVSTAAPQPKTLSRALSSHTRFRRRRSGKHRGSHAKDLLRTLMRHQNLQDIDIRASLAPQPWFSPHHDLEEQLALPRPPGAFRAGCRRIWRAARTRPLSRISWKRSGNIAEEPTSIPKASAASGRSYNVDG
jgi:hypothetical protein